MRMLIYIVTLSLMTGCMSFRVKESEEQELLYDVHRYVRGYYCIYLQYPTVDELFEYCWNMTNGVNDYRFQSYSEYMKVKEDAYTAGSENILNFLHRNRKDIQFVESNGNLIFYFKSKKMLVFNYDYCSLQKDREMTWEFFHLFDSTGIRRVVNNDEEDFFSMREEVRQEWLLLRDLKPNVFRYPTLLRYSRKTGYTFFCPINPMLHENSYLKNLGVALDTFLLNRNMETIQCVTLIPD